MSAGQIRYWGMSNLDPDDISRCATDPGARIRGGLPLFVRCGGSLVGRHHFGGTGPAIAPRGMDGGVTFGGFAVGVWWFDEFAFTIDYVNDHPSTFVVFDFDDD